MSIALDSFKLTIVFLKFIAHKNIIKLSSKAVQRDASGMAEHHNDPMTLPPTLFGPFVQVTEAARP